MTEAGAPIWSRRIADEFWSGPVTPLTFSLLAPPMVERMVRRPLRTAGLGTLAETPVFHLHASHVYVNASLLAEVINLLPGAVRSAGLLALLPAAARARVRDAGALEGLPGAAAIAAKLLLGETAWAPWQRAAAFDAACARVRTAFAARDPALAERSAWTLTAEIARVQQALGDYLAVVSWGIVFAYVFYHLLTELVRYWTPGLDAARADLTVGLPGVASLDAHDEVLALGALLARMPDAHDAGAAIVARRLAADAGAAGQAFRALLDRHGHRLSGRDLLYPTWREAPELVVALALRSARDPAPAAAAESRASAAARRAAAVATIERALGGGPAGLARRALFRGALATAQRYYVVRENMRYHADFFLARLRDLVLALGRRLADDGVIGAPADLCFLTYDEIRRLAAPAGGDETPRPAGAEYAGLTTVIAERRRGFERDAATPPPAALAAGTSGADDTLPPSGIPLALAGEAGAPGTCRGRARVVTGHADFDHVRRGDVIVAAYADPAWTPMLDLAAGLVLEAGGQLSHGAIVARELGIPALVNVAGAIRTIRTGDTVEVDATAGAVNIVARA